MLQGLASAGTVMKFESDEDKYTAVALAGIMPLIVTVFSDLFVQKSMTRNPKATIARCILYPLVGLISAICLIDTSAFWWIIPAINFFATCCITPGVFGNDGLSGVFLVGLIPVTLGVAAAVQYGIASGKIIV